ncbi:MAG: hypothetical protein GEV04_20315 [Actinophytocola sp.]|nr:hypothetical protein [Actinophytocola sp.]
MASRGEPNGAFGTYSAPNAPFGSPVACRSCGTTVLVEKFSMAHTSVQWMSDAGRSCPEFARRSAEGGLLRTCVALRDSIDRAVVAGEVVLSARETP